MTLAVRPRARHWPDRTAVIDEGTERTLSYAALADRVETTAGRLATLGIDGGDRVVVLSETRVELLELLFASLDRGSTIAPLSHRLPAETIETLSARIDPDLVVFEPQFADLAAATDARTLSVSELQSTSVDDASSSHSDAAPLFLHTGGTTGVPKIVPLTERQLKWNAITESVAWGLDDQTVTLPVLPLFHTGGWNLLTLPTLHAGGTLVLRPSFDPGATLRCIEEYGVTQLFGVAAIFQAMAADPAFDRTDFSTVDWFMSGGGPCPDAVMEPYHDRGETFCQGYGLTEGGPNNLHRAPEREATESRPDSVGRPFPDCDARLVDASGAVVDGAGTGELELSGPVTADEYLHTDDGTFDGEWVSSGDVARRDGDGAYYIIGRTDNMFVSGGENVYPEQIEEVLEAHGAVEAAGVVPIDHPTWGKVPKAVVVGSTDSDELAAYCRERLADFQIPHEYAFVSTLPTTGAGKLDRETLIRRHASPTADE